jgi:membrane-associated phospholipid phosphatase
MKILPPHPPPLDGMGAQRNLAYLRLPLPRRVGAGGWEIPFLFVAFLIVTLLVWRGATERFDAALLQWTQAHLSPHLVWFWQAISWPGYAPQSYGMSVIFVALAWWVRGRRGLILMLVALLSSPIGSLVKRLVDRPRPTPEQAQVVGGVIPSASYPSGHVVTYTVLCGLLLLFLLDALPAGPWGRRRDRVVCGILMALIVLVGPARVALGHHWPMDVVGGYLLGGTLLALLARWRYASPPLPGASEVLECS